MAHTKAQAQGMAEAREILRGLIKPGDTIYCNIKHVSKSGMLRVIALMIIDTDKDTGKPWLRDITHLAAEAMDDKMDRDRRGLEVGECGMDMCFATVYNLGSALFPDGFGLEGQAELSTRILKKTPETLTEWQAMTATGFKFARGRNGDTSGWEKSGGYALKASTL